MANLKSSKKDIRRIERRNSLNKAFKSNALKTSKKVIKLVKAGKIDEAKKMLPEAYKSIDKAKRRKIFHKNNASRKKSNLAQMINKLELGVQKK